MADFGVQATGSYDAPNAVTVKEGVVDQSGATLAATAGQAAQSGVEIYAGYKGGQYGKEVRKIVNEELGNMGIDLTAAGEEVANSPEVAGFAETVKRAQQAMQTGSITTKQKIALRVETLKRQKIEAQPWLAGVYERVGAKILSRYDTTLDLIHAAQVDAMQNSSQSAAQVRKNLEKRADQLINENNSIPPTDPSLMTNEELVAFNQGQYAIAQQHQDAEEARQEAERARADASFRMQQESHGWARETRDIAVQGAQAQVYQDRFIQGKVPKYINEVNTRYSRVVDAINTGAPIDMKAVEQATMAWAADFQNRLSADMFNFPWKDTVERDRQLEVFNKKLTDLQSLFTGDMSDVQQMARALKRLEQNDQALLPDVAPGVARLKNVFGANAVGDALSSAVDEKELGVLDGINDFMTAPQRTTARVNAKADLADGKPIQDFPVEMRPAVKKEASRILKKYADPTSALGNTDSSPDVWGNYVQAQLDGGVSPNEYQIVAVTTFYPGFTKRFADLQAANPDKAAQIGAQVQETAKLGAQGLVQTRQSMNIPDGALLATNGGFHIAPAYSGNKALRQLADRLNGTYRALVATSEYDPKAPANPNAYYMSLFGVTLPEPAMSSQD